ncbi:MAG: hypothetical protein AAGE52_28370 [Myxococcota bacterium]
MGRAFLVLLALGALGVGCGSSEATPDPLQSPELTVPAVPESSDPIYSPFVVQVGDAPFSVISFKDVGMSIPQDDREFMYESLAEGLSMELASMESAVQHMPHMSEPANHLSCEGQHIYVDLWREDQGWGYSLWSGCGEDDQFGRHAVEVEGDERIASMESLSTHIASRLRDAVRTGCFTRHC